MIFLQNFNYHLTKKTVKGPTANKITLKVSNDHFKGYVKNAKAHSGQPFPVINPIVYMFRRSSGKPINRSH